MKAFILPYKNGSRSARALADGVGIKTIRLNRSRFAGGKGTVVINWGCSDVPVVVNKAETILNRPDCVRLASNKLHFFKCASTDDRINLPPFTESKEEALEWGRTIVARQKLTGHSGEGIVLCEPDEELVEAPLYVKYIPKKEEYRVHVFNGKVVDVQRKARRNDVHKNDVNWRVRNHGNGFIFARNEERAKPADLERQAILAVEVCGLDFGAVDLIYNEHLDTVYVLEINTAPGLEGQTLTNYTNLIKEYLGG